jgi:hypothetical protein
MFSISASKICFAGAVLRRRRRFFWRLHVAGAEAACSGPPSSRRHDARAGQADGRGPRGCCVDVRPQTCIYSVKRGANSSVNCAGTARSAVRSLQQSASSG